MPARDGNSFGEFLRRHTTFIVWAVVLAMIFGLGWHKSAEGDREYRALLDWNTGYAKFGKEADAEWQRLVARFNILHAKPGSQKSLEDELNGGRPFELRSIGDRQTADWSHPKYGGSATFEFRDGVVVGENANWGTPSEELYPKPHLVARTNSTESLRLWIVTLAGLAWLVALLARSIFRRWRLTASQLLLALALAYGMAQAVNPYYPITTGGVFSNDPLFFAAVMISISVVVLAMTLAAHTNSDALLFRFGMRHVLIAITLISATLAAGPFGYLTLAVGLTGAALFAAVYLVNRTHRRATLRWMAERGYSQS